MTDYKLISYDPTPEMVSAAEGAYMPFGDMEMAIRMAILSAPAVQGERGVKWAPEEVANGNKGIRWVSDEGVHGRPTDHDCRVYLESNPNARGCHCPECTMLYTAPQPDAHQPCPEVIREGAPYDDPAFTALCREHEVYGTAAAAQCAVFWEAGKRAAEKQPAPDAAGLAASLYQACGAYDMPERILDVLSAAANGEPFEHMIDGLLPCVPPSDQDAAALVEALEQILGWRELRSGQEFPIERIEDIARNALAAYRKQKENK